MRVGRYSLQGRDYSDKGIQENTREYKRIQGNTGEYKRIQGNTGKYKGILENTREYIRQYKEIQWNGAWIKNTTKIHIVIHFNNLT